MIFVGTNRSFHGYCVQRAAVRRLRRTLKQEDDLSGRHDRSRSGAAAKSGNLITSTFYSIFVTGDLLPRCYIILSIGLFFGPS